MNLIFVYRDWLVSRSYDLCMTVRTYGEIPQRKVFRSYGHNIWVRACVTGVTVYNRFITVCTHPGGNRYTLFNMEYVNCGLLDCVNFSHSRNILLTCEYHWYNMCFLEAFSDMSLCIERLNEACLSYMIIGPLRSTHNKWSYNLDFWGF